MTAKTHARNDRAMQESAQKVAAVLLAGLTLLVFCPAGVSASESAPVSELTDECLSCHGTIQPGIVEGWRQSRHARSTPAQARAVKGLARKVSGKDIPEKLLKVSVGCAECHMLRGKAHADTFEHNGYDVHAVVSPADCAVCHQDEASQFSENLMAHAHGNLADNALYQELEKSATGKMEMKGRRIVLDPPDEETRGQTCFYCHGTKLRVTGMETRDTELAGELQFPVIEGWPNQGVGRVNTDKSLGACSACHTRHSFSVETARKPYTCKECHMGPDVPAFKVYTASKHGNIFSTASHGWNWDAVPWTVGKDFLAPTCAACHVSLLVDTDGEVVNQRTHRMSDRLPWRIFGLIYAHPYPKSPDTTIIRNAQGLPLPTSLDGSNASAYLIDPAEMNRRTATMQKTCLTCHDTAWVQGFWTRFENSIRQSDAAVLVGTDVMGRIWKKGYARGVPQGANPFDEAIEKKWSRTWLFYGNTIRFGSAMAGGGDYEVFSDGWFQMTEAVQELNDRLHR